MDHASFDRLTIAVGRLRNRATRRAALRLLLGGSAVTAVGLTAGDAAAGRRRRRCKGLGASCTRDRDCCTETCLNDRCRIEGSEQCGDRVCLPGFECCRGGSSSGRTCTPSGFPRCCGAFSFAAGFRCCRSAGSGQHGACASDSTCCPGRVGAGCCPRGMRCCDGGCCPGTMICCHGGCCPDGYRCTANGCRFEGFGARGETRTAKKHPFVERVAVDERDWTEVAPDEGVDDPGEAVA